MIRVRELATDLGVQSEDVVEFLSSVGVRVRGGASMVLADSTAARVRGKFGSPSPRAKVRQGRSGARPPGQPGAGLDESDTADAATNVGVGSAAGFSALPEPPVSERTPAESAAIAASLLNPFGAAVAVESPVQRPAPVRTEPSVFVHIPDPADLPAVDQAPDEPISPEWAKRDLSDSERADWLAAGLRDTDGRLAEQCRTAGLRPADLALRLSGRSALLRLRDGEPPSSVWARIQDGEHHPRKPTRLTGRFQLG